MDGVRVGSGANRSDHWEAPPNGPPRTIMVAHQLHLSWFCDNAVVTTAGVINNCQFSNKMSSSQFKCRRDVINDMKLRIRGGECRGSEVRSGSAGVSIRWQRTPADPRVQSIVGLIQCLITSRCS